MVEASCTVNYSMQKPLVKDPRTLSTPSTEGMPCFCSLSNHKTCILAVLVIQLLEVCVMGWSTHGYVHITVMS
jgi:hypothetical protein